MAIMKPPRANTNPNTVRIFLCEDLCTNDRQVLNTPHKLTQIPAVAGLSIGLFVTVAASQQFSKSNASQKANINRLVGFG